MGQQTAFTMAAAVTALTASAVFAGPQQTLVHTNQITLGAEFNETSGYGDNPLSITFDGTNAYVGGYNNGPASPGRWNRTPRRQGP